MNNLISDDTINSLIRLYKFTSVEHRQYFLHIIVHSMSVYLNKNPSDSRSDIILKLFDQLNTAHLTNPDVLSKYVRS